MVTSKHKPMEGSDWEKEFSSSQFGKDCSASLPFIRYKQLKSFISSLLQTTRNEVLSEVENRIESMKVITGNPEAEIGANAFKRAILNSLKK